MLVTGFIFLSEAEAETGSTRAQLGARKDQGRTKPLFSFLFWGKREAPCIQRAECYHLHPTWLTREV